MASSELNAPLASVALCLTVDLSANQGAVLFALRVDGVPDTLCIAVASGLVGVAGEAGRIAILSFEDAHGVRFARLKSALGSASALPSVPHTFTINVAGLRLTVPVLASQDTRISGHLAHRCCEAGGAW